MSTYTRILYQIVFGSKFHASFLNKSNEKILFSYIAGIANKKRCLVYIVGGYRNHIHIILDIHPTVSLSALVRDIKAASHEMMVESASDFPRFPGWQVGYSAFTYDVSALDNLCKYVRNQRIHHQKKDARKEFIESLNKHKVKVPRRFLQ